MRGLINIGNTCYLNTGLHALLDNNHLCDLINKYSMSSEILGTINNFIVEYNDGKTNPISPIEIKKIIGKRNNTFDDFSQQDSSEFIIYLLDVIDEEIKKINSPHHDFPIANELEQIYGIDFDVRIKCKLKTCLKINHKIEKNYFLLLDIESNDKTLNDVYKHIKSGVKLENDNKYYCENCKEKRIASKRTNVIKWPQHLLIGLKKYKQIGNNIVKINQKIDIPLEWRHNMTLKGAILHFGNLNGGHYVYVKKNNDKWFVINDSSVNEISSQKDLFQILYDAYWLYYEQN